MLHTPINLILKLFEVFFLEATHRKLKVVRKGEKYSLRNSSRMQSIELDGQRQYKHNLKTVNLVDF